MDKHNKKHSNKYIWLIIPIALLINILFNAQGKALGPDKYENASAFFSFAMGTIFFFFALLTYPLFKIYYRNKAFEKCKNEKPICYYQPSVVIGMFLQFCAGGFIGWFILPFFIISDLTHIGAITRQNLWFFIILAASLPLIANCLQYTTIVLTKTRIIEYVSWMGWKETFLKDIKSASITKRKIPVTCFDNTILYFHNYPKKDAKKFYSELKKLIEEKSDDSSP